MISLGCGQGDRSAPARSVVVLLRSDLSLSPMSDMTVNVRSIPCPYVVRTVVTVQSYKYDTYRIERIGTWYRTKQIGTRHRARASLQSSQSVRKIRK